MRSDFRPEAMVNEAAECLYSCYSRGETIDRSMADRFCLNSENGYLVQDMIASLKQEKRGERVRGYKISLTSPETQKWFNASEPAYGTLTDSNILEGALSFENLSEPLIEAELMFHVEKDIFSFQNDEDLLENISVAPGIEIPDSRFVDWFPKLPLGAIVADNAVAGRVVSGYQREKLTLEELGNIKLDLFLDGKSIARGHSRDVLGNPLESLKWLVRKLERKGKYLKNGMVISSGTLVLPLKLEKGKYTACYSLPGNVSLDVT
jgi:2-keto-4-pentenoate hydratase